MNEVAIGSVNTAIGVPNPTLTLGAVNGFGILLRV